MSLNTTVAHKEIRTITKEIETSSAYELSYYECCLTAPYLRIFSVMKDTLLFLLLADHQIRPLGNCIYAKSIELSGIFRTVNK